ncbi:MAG: ABC transporter permease, partial [Deltaproteobacteria bacterium]|nr:ABC transporter permease [Deltaproteobacteria bacterium]
LGGYIIIWTITYLPMGNFPVKIAQAISVSDIAVGLVKAILFGMTVTTVALYHGIGIKRRFTQLPQVTSRALIECFFYCLVINIFISAVFYL